MSLVQSISPSKESNAPQPSASRRHAGWWHAPQRLRLRRAIFQVHLWLGVILTLYSIVIGLSGSVLVFRKEIEDHLYGRQLQVQPTVRQVTLADAVQRIERDRSGWMSVGLRDFQSQDHAAMLLMRLTANPASTNIRYVYFNPYTGQVVLDRMRYDNLLGWMTNLHYYLLSGRLGLTVSGWMAVGLLLLCVSGVLLWWPGVSRWMAAVVLHRRSNWKRINWDLHSVVGFWSSAALLGVTFTGVYFAFALPIGGAIVVATGGSIQQAMQYVASPKARPAAPGTPLLPMDRAVAILNRELSPAPPAQYLQLPTRPGDVYGAISYYPHTIEYTQMRRVAVDPHGGAVLAVADTHQMQFGMHVIQYFHAFHFGTFGGAGPLGIVVRVVWVFVGLTPAMLAVTGLLMYWNRKLHPAWKRLQ
ncbi:putative iron-regulated membrane protein [Terriglobus roseus DSM 18391]|uniref:Putative iron-regulated membrane protein n=1 Tax=Terriglobus roseus (strain DSM 18391 / NRRL B-41598 / KBS 63) TaxID=926566 RepID=I3ZJ65_TERRK|nr:PepSY-associated TM helix domain-containing protein [Terriglobus roseus]AFL89283.1 putative iron-regulated membrane protein [Terriglobus roseus DSM 18391]